MILAAYTQRLNAQFTTVGTGLSVYASWATIQGTTSKVIATDNTVAAVPGDAGTYTVIAYADSSTQSADPNRMRKVLMLSVRNNAASARPLQFYMERSDGGGWTYQLTPAFNIPAGGMLYYSPETGWKVYDSNGSDLATGPTGATGAVGPAGANGTGTTVEKHLGYTPTFTGKFTITDASITSSSKVIVTQAPGPYTGKGTRADEAEMEPIICTAYPDTGSATVRWRVASGPRVVTTPFQGNASINSAATLAPPQYIGPMRRLKATGAAWKNMKFTYTILG